MNSVVASVLSLFGITQVPTTAQEFLWDALLIVVGLYVVKYVWLFFSDLFTEMIRMR